jgi:hypothetical protein
MPDRSPDGQLVDRSVDLDSRLRRRGRRQRRIAPLDTSDRENTDRC